MWFVSDLHFGHKNVLDYDNRPFTSIQEHDNIIIQNWNDTIKENDEVYLLGDVGLSNLNYILSLVKRLKGKIHLIKGNHDSQKLINKIGHLFETVQDYERIKVKDSDAENGMQRICLFHFPITVWDKEHRGSWHLHGHCHGTLPQDNSKRLDVGICTNLLAYYPIHYDDIKQIMKNKTFEPKDHHTTYTN